MFRVVDLIFTGRVIQLHLQVLRNKRQVFVWVLAGIILCSCEPETSEIGADFFNDGALDFSYIDSATVKLSTIQFEELATGGASRILIGTHHDEKLGKITASPYFQLIPSSSIDLQDEDVVYDYLSLVLPYDGYSYYDTVTTLTLNVHRVIEDIETDEGYLYNNSEFTIESEPLGSIAFKPKPHGDSIEIILSDVLGKEIFQKAKDASDDLTSTNFLKYIRGLAVIPDTAQSACIIGLTTTPKLKLNYIDRSLTPSQKKFSTFEMSASSSLYFTNITWNRDYTNLDVELSVKDRLSSVNTDDEAYLQAGTGLALRVDLPYLRSLKQLTNFYVTQAVLEIFTVRKSSDELTPLPAQLKVYKVDKRNSVYAEPETVAYLIEDIDLDRNTRYSFDATEFVKEQMELQTLNENALIFTTDIESYPITTDRIYAAAPGYEYKTRLRIFFATVNN